MTPLRQDAQTLLAEIPEERLALVVEFLRDMTDMTQRRDTAEAAQARRAAFATLERMIKPVPHLDYDKALAEYREEKYGSASVDWTVAELDK